MAFGNILSDIQGIVGEFNNLFGKKPAAKAYPNKLGSQTDTKDITNFITSYETKDWKSSRGYAFAVYQVKPDGKWVGDKPDAPGWSEFRLQINPQEMTQDEIFAIEVTPTFRGVLVEHQGTILKDITISGTTGVSPMRKEGGATANSGRPILATGRSGYEEFHELRSYFRAYVEAKRLDTREKGELRLVFKNYKDNEFIYVEPQKFTMKRSAKSPFMYEYNIQMKGVGNTNYVAQDKGLFERINDVLEDVQDYFNLGSKVIAGASGILLRFERDVQSTILNPILSIQQALLAIQGGKALVLSNFGFTRSKIDYLRKNVERVEASFSDGIGRNNSSYNAMQGRTPTLVGVTGRQSTYQEFQILNALGALKKGLILLQSQQDALFEQDIFALNSAVASTFKDKFSIKTPNSVRAVGIGGGDDLQTIALRELGDPDRFRDIAILNNLKPPYIDAAGGPGVLKPGDQILIPQSNQSVDGSVKNKEYNITKGMSEAEKSLGVDIRLNEDGDFVISNIKDLDLVAGVENMVQACAMKLALEKGSLKRHRGLGVGLLIGRKSSNSIKEIRDDVIATFSADSRVDQIPYVDVRQEGGTLFLNMLVKLKDVEQPVPIPIRLNVA